MSPMLREKGLRLLELYREFDEAVREWSAGAVCRPGCADCCTNVGSIDATTLEAWAIHTLLLQLPPAARKELARRLKTNRRDKRTARFARCAFLLEDQTCAVYPARPFSCRRLYSVKVCGETGPTVHRSVWDTAERTLAAILALDDTGYSGHIAYVLALLNDAAFRNLYLDGGFDPGVIQAYAREHGLSINRFRKPSP